MIIKLCEETGAKIVISSSWRGWSLKATLKDFSRYRDLSKLNPYSNYNNILVLKSNIIKINRKKMLII